MRSFVLLLTVLMATSALAAVALVLRTGSPSGPVSHLELAVPARVTAGDVVDVRVSSDPGVTVTVLFIDAYRTSSRTITMERPDVRLAVPGTRYAGELDVVAIAGGKVAEASILVASGEIAGTVPPLLGARSIVADGADKAMVVAIPSDRFGNPVAPGTPVSITVVHPDATRIRRTTVVERTLAWSWIRSGTTAGTARVTASAGGVEPHDHRTLIEIPAAPVPFGLVVETGLLPADGSSLISVASDQLRDPHGNVLLDGTAAVVRAAYPDGSVVLQTNSVIGGVARALLEAPGDGGTVQVVMTVQDTSSSSLDVPFEQPVEGRPATVLHGESR